MENHERLILSVTEAEEVINDLGNVGAFSVLENIAYLVSLRTCLFLFFFYFIFFS